jgi:hypothetical protein
MLLAFPYLPYLAFFRRPSVGEARFSLAISVLPDLAFRRIETTIKNNAKIANKISWSFMRFSPIFGNAKIPL